MEGTTISDLLINEQIRDKEVRVIGEEGEQLGIMSVKEALALAEEAGVDLIIGDHPHCLQVRMKQACESDLKW